MLFSVSPAPCDTSPPFPQRAEREFCCAGRLAPLAILALFACSAPHRADRRVAPPVLPAGVRLVAERGEGSGLSALVQETSGVRLLVEVRGLAPGKYTLGLAADLDSPVQPLATLQIPEPGRGRFDRELPGRRLVGEGGLVGQHLVLYGPGGLLSGVIERGIEVRSAPPGRAALTEPHPEATPSFPGRTEGQR